MRDMEPNPTANPIPPKSTFAGGSSSAAPEQASQKYKQRMPDSELVDVAQLQSRVFELEQDKAKKDMLVEHFEKELAIKDAEIASLKTSLGDLSARLVAKFGDEFKLGDPVPPAQPFVPRQRANPSSDDDIDEYLASETLTMEQRLAREARRKERELKRANIMLKRNLNADAPDATASRPEFYMHEVGKRFTDKFGDRSGVNVWGFDAERSMYYIKRKTLNVEYYEKKNDILKLTRIDLRDLARAPFNNPSNDSDADKFQKFIIFAAKKNFAGWKLPKSFLKRQTGVIDPKTGRTLKQLMWPAPKRAKKIPMATRMPEGSLRSFVFWVYDPETTTVVIKLEHGQYRLVDPKDLMKFGEEDIRRLAMNQIKVENPMFEEAAKEFTGTVAKIIESGMWAGSLANTAVDVNLVIT